MPSTTFPMLAPTTSRSWQADAACADADPELFFSTDEHDRRAARQMCSSCPVRTACLEHAIATGEAYGIWGGADEQERKRLARRRVAA